MQIQDVTTYPPMIAPSGHPVLERNAQGLIPNFWEWYEWVKDAAQLYFPSSFKELIAAPLIETENEVFVRFTRDIPMIPLVDDKDELLSIEECAALALLSTSEERERARSYAVRELQKKLRAENAAISMTNEYRVILLEQRMARHEALVLERPRLAAWLVCGSVMPPTIHDEIKSDERYLPGVDGFVPAHVIMSIACRLLGGVLKKNNTKMRMALDDELRAVKQGNLPTHTYCTAFRKAHTKCLHAGTRMDTSDIIAYFVYGLNLQIFEHYIKAFNLDPTVVPDSLGAVMADALAYLQGAIEVNPSLSKVLDYSTMAPLAYSTNEPSPVVSSTPAHITFPIIPPSSPIPALKCQLCLRGHHDARACFKLSLPDFIRKVVEAQPARRKSKGGPRSKCVVSGGLQDANFGRRLVNAKPEPADTICGERAINKRPCVPSDAACAANCEYLRPVDAESKEDSVTPICESFYGVSPLCGPIEQSIFDEKDDSKAYSIENISYKQILKPVCALEQVPCNEMSNRVKICDSFISLDCCLFGKERTDITIFYLILAALGQLVDYVVDVFAGCGGLKEFYGAIPFDPGKVQTVLSLFLLNPIAKITFERTFKSVCAFDCVVYYEISGSGIRLNVFCLFDNERSAITNNSFLSSPHCSRVSRASEALQVVPKQMDTLPEPVNTFSGEPMMFGCSEVPDDVVCATNLEDVENEDDEKPSGFGLGSPDPALPWLVSEAQILRSPKNTGSLCYVLPRCCVDDGPDYDCIANGRAAIYLPMFHCFLLVVLSLPTVLLDRALPNRRVFGCLATSYAASSSKPAEDMVQVFVTHLRSGQFVALQQPPNPSKIEFEQCVNVGWGHVQLSNDFFVARNKLLYIMRRKTELLAPGLEFGHATVDVVTNDDGARVSGIFLNQRLLLVGVRFVILDEAGAVASEAQSTLRRVIACVRSAAGRKAGKLVALDSLVEEVDDVILGDGPGRVLGAMLHDPGKTRAVLLHFPLYVIAVVAMTPDFPFQSREPDLGYDTRLGLLWALGVRFLLSLILQSMVSYRYLSQGGGLTGTVSIIDGSGNKPPPVSLLAPTNHTPLSWRSSCAMEFCRQAHLTKTHVSTIGARYFTVSVILPEFSVDHRLVLSRTLVGNKPSDGSRVHRSFLKCLRIRGCKCI